MKYNRYFKAVKDSVITDVPSVTLAEAPVLNHICSRDEIIYHSFDKSSDKHNFIMTQVAAETDNKR